MADKPDREAKMPDPLQMSQMMTDIAERSQRVVADFLSRQSPMAFGNPDPLNLGQAFFDMTARMMQNPAKLVQAQISLWQDYMSLWQSTTRKMLGEPSEPVATPAADDRRFKDALWDENYVFDFIKQSYLLSARWLQGRVKEVEGLDDKTARKVDFYTRQFVDAMAPSNFAMTNPEVVRETLDTGGENLVKGLQNLLGDLERGKGKLQIRMTDMDAFRVGENIAVTPGAVVYRNDLMELIHYKPTTETVVKAPLLIVPPWINKFYILDLREKNSFIKWAVDQGHSVFVISWVNPDAELAEKSFDDYMVEGPLAAMDAIEKATGERQVDIIGYCLGGTLTACTLAYLAAKGEKRVASATFFTTMVDFEEAGELSVFIDEEQLAAIEEKMNERGFLDGAEDPFPFDLLYWNSDSTRMPAAMHSFYLRQMYQENRLSRGKIKLLGTKIDLTKIDVPVFILSTREDHIAPWKSTYVATQLYTGPTTFCLAASGHIAGVVNPPAGNKYCHWTSDKLPKKPDQWLESATQHPGSWWPTWDAWVKGFAGEQVPARSPGEGKLKVIGPAPGSYVKVKAQ
ncbi:MAG: PHA/PHB synthase family protein [Tagaea sp.]